MTVQPAQDVFADMATPLNAGELAWARSRTYTLLSHLFLHGLSADLVPVVAVIPELAACPADFDPDQAAADHQALLGFALFPYQSIFLDPSGLVGGEESARVQQHYTYAGFTPATSTESLDHIGHELAYLAFLGAAASEAWADQRGAIAQQLQRRQVDFLQNHLLRWLPPFVLAIQRQRHPFYTALVEFTVALIDSQLAEADGTTLASPFLLPAAPTALEARATTLHDIAQWLLCPPYSGLFLSRDVLGRLARRHQLPRGFGERALLLVNLLRSAIKYGCFPAVINDLHALVTNEVQAHQRLTQSTPTLTPYTDIWETRLATTASLLLRINALAADELARLQQMETE